MAKLKTSVANTLELIKGEVEATRKSIALEAQKSSKRELSELPDTFSQKEKLEYITKVQPQLMSIYKMSSLGYRQSTIASVLGVSVLAFRKMCREIQELNAVMELATEDKLDRVEESVIQLATGYEVEEEVINPFDGTVQKLTRYKDPVLGAGKYVLSNLRSDKYADKRQIIKKVELGSDIKEALLAYKPEDLKRILALSDAKDEAITAEYTESGSDGEEE